MCLHVGRGWEVTFHGRHLHGLYRGPHREGWLLGLHPRLLRGCSAHLVPAAPGQGKVSKGAALRAPAVALPGRAVGMLTCSGLQHSRSGPLGPWPVITTKGTGHTCHRLDIRTKRFISKHEMKAPRAPVQLGCDACPSPGPPPPNLAWSKCPGRGGPPGGPFIATCCGSEETSWGVR